MMLIIHLYSCLHVNLPRDTSTNAGGRDERQTIHLVLEEFHHVVISGGVFDVVPVLHRCMAGARKHVPHLHLHHQRHGNQKDSQHVLHDDEHLAQHHLAAEAKAALDYIYRLIAGSCECRKETADDPKQQDAQDISGHVTRRHHQ